MRQEFFLLIISNALPMKNKTARSCERAVEIIAEAYLTFGVSGSLQSPRG